LAVAEDDANPAIFQTLQCFELVLRHDSTISQGIHLPFWPYGRQLGPNPNVGSFRVAGDWTASLKT